MNLTQLRAHRRWALRLLCVLLVASALLPVLAGCSLHSGGDALAFLRDGQLWTIHSDGSQPLQLTGSHVVGFAWSPDHHELVLRIAAVPAPTPPTGIRAAPAAPGDIAAVSINGGAALQLTPTSAGLSRGDAWWNPNGNRILYTERAAPPPQPATFVVSQVDQPVGIARHPLLNVAGLPVLSPDGMRVAAVSPDGVLLLGPPGQAGRSIASDVLRTLPGMSRPARVLWQPGHDALLYALAAPTGVTLDLRSLSGSVREVVTLPAVLDYAFAPDGSLLLVREPTRFSLWSVSQPGQPLWTWPETDPLALPSWSPDGHQVLVQNGAGLQLADLRTKTVHALLTYEQSQMQAPPDAHTDWHPAAGSPWATDGHALVFAAATGASWQGRPLPQPHGATSGLYVVSITSGTVGRPVLVDSGDDRAPSWSFLDPSTAFLMAS
jgi:dipeptidyl aminopeptidase/acylaminoacyl peptidase